MLGRSRSKLHEILIEEAATEGFPLAGGVDLDLALNDPEARFASHVEQLDLWLTRGSAGAMSYLARGRDRRADPRLVFLPTQSVFSVAIPYPRKPAGSQDPLQGPRYARYIQGPDYHQDLTERLERAMVRARTRWLELAPSVGVQDSAGLLEWKICVDASAVLERTWAWLAGLGWIGKNTMLIHPRHGSYLFLAEVLLSVKLDQGPRPMRDYCGHCERCLKACPTSALTAPRTLDSNQCISYMTLEKRGSLPLASETARKTGNWIAGCDLCQEVCPFNFRPVKNELAENKLLKNRIEVPALDPDPRDATRLQDWVSLLEEVETGYRSRIQRSALERIKPADFRRNLAWTLRNTLNSASRDERIGLDPRIRPFVETRLKNETLPEVEALWQECLGLLI